MDFFGLTVSDGLVKVNLYFDNDVVGIISNVSLIDTDGDVVALAVRSISKPLSKGLYIGFKYKFDEVEVGTVVV